MKEQKSEITTEIAYVKSRDLLEKGISNTVNDTKKVKHYQNIAIISSFAIGGLLWLFSQNLAAFFVSLILINGSVQPLIIRVLRAYRRMIEEMTRCKEKLEKGELDPNAFYASQTEYFNKRNNPQVLDRLSDDTSRLTPEEREMLLKFHKEGPDQTEF